MKRRGLRLAAIATGAAGLLVACAGEPDVPEVVGEDRSFARGALEAAELDYEIVDVDVEDPDEEGVVQEATYDESMVIVEVGALPTITITGDFTLVDTDQARDTDREDVVEGDPCTGTGGYSDFGSAMNVTVTDGAGEIIGTTSTGAAEYVDAGRSSTLFCQTSFDIDVAVVDFYRIEIGSRGDMSYSFDELRDRDFHIELTLGR